MQILKFACTHLDSIINSFERLPTTYFQIEIRLFYAKHMPQKIFAILHI